MSAQTPGEALPLVSPDAAAEPGLLKRRTLRSVIWTVIRAGSGAVISFAVFSLLARLLTPTDFGLFALASLFVEFSKIISQAGVGDALQRQADLDEVLADTAFWANLGIAVLIALLIWVVAEPYSRIWGRHEVATLLRALGLVLPITALGGIHTARKLRDFGHKAIALRATASAVCGGAVAVAAALHGWGAWSLVAQQFVAELINLLLAWTAFPWRPRMRFSRRHLDGILHFSVHMMLTQVVWFALVRTQDVFIGRVIGPTAEGVYRVAWRLIDLINQVTVVPITTVATITLSKLQNDAVALANAYRRMISVAALLTIPAIVGFGALAPDLVAFLFGARWADSANIARVLSFLAPATTITFFDGPVFGALGRSSTLLKLASVVLAAVVAATAVGVQYGLTVAAAMYVVTSYLTLPYQLFLLRRETGIHPRTVLGAVAPPLGAALLMAGVLTVAAAPLHAALPSHAAYLAAAIPTGMLCYLVALGLFGRSFLRANLSAIRPLLARSAG